MILCSGSQGIHDHILLSDSSGSLTPFLLGQVRTGQLLLALSNIVILGSKLRGAHDCILLSHISGSHETGFLTHDALYQLVVDKLENAM